MAAAELKDAKEATCTEVGYTGDKVCKYFGISKYTLYSYLDNSKTGGTNEL